MTRLVSFHCDDVPSLGRIGLQRTADPIGPLQDHHVMSKDGKSGSRVGWTVRIRGAAMFLCSPPGWDRNKPSSQWEATGKSRVFEVPRAKVSLEWECDDFTALEKAVQRYDSEPMVRKVAEVPAVNLREVGDA